MTVAERIREWMNLIALKPQVVVSEQRLLFISNTAIRQWQSDSISASSSKNRAAEPRGLKGTQTWASDFALPSFRIISLPAATQSFKLIFFQ